MSADVFGTHALRDRVLGTWRTDPARLREDANTEEDHARGYYRDRVVVELAQNAADAAARAGSPGRLLLRLGPDPDRPGDPGAAVLVVANTGAPVDAAGVASMSAMRASASRGHTDRAGAPALVGRYGVGFAAVRSVADRVVVASTTGAVDFDLDRTRADLAEVARTVPALAEEVRRRDGSLPALRLPYPVVARPEPGYDTTVLLHLRDRAALAAVRAMLAEVGDPLLLALPALAEVVVEDDLTGARRRVADLDRRWRRLTAEGELPIDLLADRPVEERARRRWRITWALPRDTATGPAAGFGSGGADHRDARTTVVHAPTPTDDPLSLPALLVATLPLDPTRRHVASGPATDALLALAADLYARLAQQRACAGADPLALVPVGLPAGPLDADLAARIVDRMSRTPLLAPAGPPDAADRPDHRHDDGRLWQKGASPDTDLLVEPDRAVTVVGAGPQVVAALARWFAALVHVPAGSAAAARTLGVTARDLADIIDDLPAVGAPADWRELYAALTDQVADPLVRERLIGLPVPLADGRVVRGARGLLLPVGADQAVTDAVADLSPWGVRVVHPEAAHEVLERLGALPADPVALLAHPGVRQAVLDTAGEDDLDVAEQVTDAVLTLLRAALADGLPAGTDQPLPPARAALGLLTLRDADGEAVPAHGLLLPGSPAARVLDPRVLAEADPAQIDRWGPAVLAAAGVRADLVVLALPEQVAGSDGATLAGPEDDAADLATEQLDGWDAYLAHLAETFGEGATVEASTAVADLDAVHPDRWPDVLARLAEPGPARQALTDPVHAVDAPGSAPGYTAWWLRHRAGLGLDHPFAAADADPGLSAVLDPAPAVLHGLDPHVQHALGGLRHTHQVPAPAWEQVLRATGPVGGPVDVALALAAWTAWGVQARPWSSPRAPDLDATPFAATPEPTTATGGADPDGDRGALAGLEVLPALVGPGAVALVHAEDAAVAPAPMWWQRTDLAAMLPAPAGADPAALADLLDLPLADDLADGTVDDQDGDDRGTLSTTPDGIRTLLPHAPTTWVEHEDLRVDAAPVDWWVQGTGPSAVVHATSLAALARGLAQAAGDWPARHTVEAVLADADRLVELTVEQVADPGRPA